MSQFSPGERSSSFQMMDSLHLLHLDRKSWAYGLINVKSCEVCTRENTQALRRQSWGFAPSPLPDIARFHPADPQSALAPSISPLGSLCALGSALTGSGSVTAQFRGLHQHLDSKVTKWHFPCLSTNPLPAIGFVKINNRNRKTCLFVGHSWVYNFSLNLQVENEKHPCRNRTLSELEQRFLKQKGSESWWAKLCRW